MIDARILYSKKAWLDPLITVVTAGTGDIPSPKKLHYPVSDG
jgi:hypothetical protein